MATHGTAALVLLSALLPWVWLAHAQPSIAVVYPPTHSALSVDPLSGAIHQLVVELAIHGFRVPEDGVVHISGEKIGDYSDGVVHAHATRFVRLGGVELGSHFWTFALVYANRSVVPGPSARTTLHFEVVLPQDTRLPHWHYTPTRAQRRPKILFNPVRRGTPSRHRLCLVGSSDALFDGQKKMWSQAIAALPRHAWDVRFVTFAQATSNSPFADLLRQLNVSMQSVPLMVNVDDLAAYGLSASQAIPRTLQAFNDVFPNGSRGAITFHAFQRRVGELHPPYTARLWKRTVEALHETCQDAVLVMANSKDISDQLLVTAARIAGVRAVAMEMANLGPVALHVDALVAPSHYALQHPSTTESVTAHQRYVLNTGVDTALFRPARTGEVAARESCTIGYIGRLATDKSVGLVIEVARLLARSCPHTCRVRVIGDGPLRDHLESLVNLWRIDGIVHFTGGVYTESTLVREIQRLDLVVSPGFHETFGIAPLEAMSCGKPVVSFASGGVHEYLEHNVNGLVVNEPTAAALHRAILTLCENDDLRRLLGEQARRTVLERFDHHNSVQQFVKLYERLAQR